MLSTSGRCIHRFCGQGKIIQDILHVQQIHREIKTTVLKEYSRGIRCALLHSNLLKVRIYHMQLNSALQLEGFLFALKLPESGLCVLPL